LCHGPWIDFKWLTFSIHLPVPLPRLHFFIQGEAEFRYPAGERPGGRAADEYGDDCDTRGEQSIIEDYGRAEEELGDAAGATGDRE
jgi:hypothetical protein